MNIRWFLHCAHRARLCDPIFDRCEGLLFIYVKRQNDSVGATQEVRCRNTSHPINVYIKDLGKLLVS